MTSLIKTGDGMRSNFKKRLAVTMGDPAGIGPEIAVRAVTSAKIKRICRPVIVGCRPAVERALALLGKKKNYVSPLRLFRQPPRENILNLSNRKMLKAGASALIPLD
jgi:4-hydroxy-L-threonine phosphate dehydrogenase PdxA